MSADVNTLIPPPVTAKAERRKRFAAAFGPRFFLLIVIGLVWLGAAFYDPRFYYALAGWDALVVVLWIADLATLPLPKQIAVTRRWTGAAALSVPQTIELGLENSSRIALFAALIDNVPPHLRAEAPELDLKCRARGEATVSYRITPARRGDVELGAVYVRYQTPMRIAERWAVAHLEQKVCVYPNLEEARQHSVYLIRSRQIEMEKRHTRIRGAGREFESLREYREGDEFRDICWTAAARRGKLVTRLFQIERSQTIWLVVDSGRLMRARIGGLTKLDYAVNAALSLAEVALGTGDRVGLLAYGRGVKKRMLPHRGGAHLRQMIQQLAHVREEPLEGDHLQAVSALLSTQKRRSMVVWLTDFPETAMTPEVIDAASEAASRHLVLFVVIGQPDLAALAASEPDSVTRMYRTTAAQEALHRREVLLAKLRQRGALAVEVSSAAASVTVVNSYLDVKQRNLL
ncbi:MAG TPA: DUF58 domain-containing protein [Terriglobales bacterium]|nr:DUF58 domain-containing protein [Terriglobales bacterium]